MKCAVCALLLASVCIGQQQTGNGMPTNPPATNSSAGTRQHFFGGRKALLILGGVAAGSGVALLLTSGRTQQVPAFNCSFYPAPFVPCIPAHAVKTRSGVQDGVGGGLMLGGLITLWVGLAK